MLTSNIFSSNPISGKLWLKLYMTLFSIILSKCSLVIYSQVTHSSKILRLYLVWKMKRRDKKNAALLVDITCEKYLWHIPWCQIRINFSLIFNECLDTKGTVPLENQTIFINMFSFTYLRASSEYMKKEEFESKKWSIWNLGYNLN